MALGRNVPVHLGFQRAMDGAGLADELAESEGREAGFEILCLTGGEKHELKEGPLPLIETGEAHVILPAVR